MKNLVSAVSAVLIASSAAASAGSPVESLVSPSLDEDVVNVVDVADLVHGVGVDGWVVDVSVWQPVPAVVVDPVWHDVSVWQPVHASVVDPVWHDQFVVDPNWLMDLPVWSPVA